MRWRCWGAAVKSSPSRCAASKDTSVGNLPSLSQIRSQSSNRFHRVANPGTFSPAMTSYCPHSSARTRSHAVARVCDQLAGRALRSSCSTTSSASSTASSRVATCGALFPPAGAASLQIGEPTRTRAYGRRRMSSVWTFSHSARTPGKLSRTVATAGGAWLNADRARNPAARKPSRSPPPPVNRWLAVLIARPPTRHRWRGRRPWRRPAAGVRSPAPAPAASTAAARRWRARAAAGR